MSETYFLIQGKLWIADRDSLGNPGPFRYLGNVPSAKISLKVDKVTHKESTSGMRREDASVVIGQECAFDGSLESFDLDNLAMGLYGSKVTVAGSTVTAEAMPSGAVVGSLLPLSKQDVSSVVVKDSTGSPKTLTVDVNYKVNAKAGSIEILDLTTGGAYVQPLKVDFAYAAQTPVGIFMALPVEKVLRFEGINKKDLKNIVVQLYRVQLDPLGDLDLITDKFSSAPLKGAVLLDDTKASSASLGQFGYLNYA
jgi:hypothetical protein